MDKKLFELINRQVANFGVFYVKLHNYHWLVKGKHFFRLHDKFEELYDEVTEHFDALAERVIMFNYKPVASLKGFLELTSLKEATGKESSLDMINEVINDLKQIDKELAEIISLASENEDDVTADIMIGIRASFQKQIWMLSSFIEK